MKTKILCSILGVTLIHTVGLLAQTWDSPNRLTWNPGISVLPVVAIDFHDMVYVVWLDSTPGVDEIYFKRSIDQGSSWGAMKRLTWNTTYSDSPYLAIGPGKTLNVVWTEYIGSSSAGDIFYKNSSGSGNTWTGTQRLTWSSDDSRYPTASVDSSGNLYVLWREDISWNNMDIYLKKSTNSGTNWSAIKRLTWNSGDSRSPHIVTDSSNNIHIVWSDDSSGNYEILYKKSTNGGTNWLPNQRLTWSSGISGRPFIAASSGNNIYIVWQDSVSGNDEIYFKKSTDSGNTWLALQRLTWNSGDSSSPVITVDSSSNLHLVWEDQTPGCCEVFYKLSANAGTSWSAPQRLTWNSGWSEVPFAAVDSTGYIQVLWHDNTPGGYEIFHKRGR